MKKTLMLLALLGLFIAGCESTPRNDEPVVDETTEEATDNGDEKASPDGQDAKEVIFVLGVNGMD